MRKKVLIVDDSKEFSSGLENIIKSLCGETVSEIVIVHSGEECLAVLSKETFDIIFLDYEMPGLKGHEVAKTITRENRFCKIIAISFHSDDKYLEQMIKAGARNYIIKDQLNAETIIDSINN